MVDLSAVLKLPFLFCDVLWSFSQLKLELLPGLKKNKQKINTVIYYPVSLSFLKFKQQITIYVVLYIAVLSDMCNWNGLLIIILLQKREVIIFRKSCYSFKNKHFSLRTVTAVSILMLKLLITLAPVKECSAFRIKPCTTTQRFYKH